MINDANQDKKVEFEPSARGSTGPQFADAVKQYNEELELRVEDNEQPG